MQYLCFISSIFLYIIAPETKYSLTFCIAAFVIFLISALCGMRKMNKVEFFGFNLLFTLSFFGCCYIFPLFIYNIDAYYSIFEIGYDQSVITKSTCLATVAYCCYICGLLQNINTLIAYKTANGINSFRITKKNISPNLIFYISAIFFILFFISGGYRQMYSQYAVEVSDFGIASYFYVLLSITPILISYSLNCNFKKKYMFFVACFVLLFLAIGSRTLPLALLLGAFYVFNSQHRVSKKTILMLFCVGILLMSLVGAVRGGGDITQQTNVGFWNIFLDLIINNRNLYDAYAIEQERGVVPTVFLGSILSVIPMAQSFFVSLTGMPDYALGSAAYFTYERLGANPSLGLGTNIVGDVFIGGGFLTVIILFYFLGYFITKSLNKIYIKGNWIWYIFYLSMVTNGVYICRSSIFTFVRSFVWAIAIMYVIMIIARKEVHR